MNETPSRVLVVIPHPDDAEGWCGGTIASWAKGGAHVFYVLCTDGSKGTDDPEMSQSTYPRSGRRSSSKQPPLWALRTSCSCATPTAS